MALDASRWKLELKHRIDLFSNDQDKTYLNFDITALSDRFFLEDFEQETVPHQSRSGQYDGSSSTEIPNSMQASIPACD